MLADYHVHTAYSDDSDYPMADVVRDAIAMGLNEICITEHTDYGIKRDADDPRGVIYRPGAPGQPSNIPLTNADVSACFRELQRLRGKYAGRITLRFGMEFGMQMHTIPQYEALYLKYPFDFVLLSVHEVGNKEFWNQDFQQGRAQDDYNRVYYEEMLSLVRNYHHYSVIGHMDLISRYDKYGPWPFEKVRPYAEEILRTAIADGKGIELNTSCHRYGLSDLTPSRDILRLYRELGGEILTIGSDSHKPQHLGAFLRESQQELCSMGFRYFCTFDQMKPIFHKLDA